MVKISFIFACRIENGRENLLNRYFKSLTDCCDDLNNVEVVIKFDDDQDISEAKKIIDHYSGFLQIKYVVTPRGQGYKHLSYFYTELLFIIDNNSKLISAHSIDLVFVKKSFDTILLNAATKFGDGIFVLHPISNLSFSSEIKSVNDAIQRPDNFPLWSKRWIEIQGHFGYNSSVDGWSQLTEFFLFNDYKIDRRIDLTNHNLFQEVDNVDRDINSKYWTVKRREAMQHHLSQQNIDLARQNAKNIALNIKAYYDNESEGNNKIEPIKVSYTQHLINAILDSYDSAIRTKEKEMQCLRDQIKERNNTSDIIEKVSAKIDSLNESETRSLRFNLKIKRKIKILVGLICAIILISSAELITQIIQLFF
ncbi:MAG: hypothetical protein EBS06_04415 [Proteobacteria bacterium]|nr:hypothetical protein [Pseudomonadota bacterium]